MASVANDRKPLQTPWEIVPGYGEHDFGETCTPHATQISENKRRRTQEMLARAVSRLGGGLAVRLIPANLADRPCVASWQIAARPRLASRAPLPPLVECSRPDGCVCTYSMDCR